MSKRKAPVKGFSYRFNLGTKKSAVDVMFDVHVRGRRNDKQAVQAAKGSLEMMFNLEEGDDFESLRHGRIYFHTKNITAANIVDVCPILFND